VTFARLVADFNGSLRIEPRPERLTSEAGAIVLREVLERVGIVDWVADRVPEPRDPALITHPLAELLRTAVLLVAQGWRDQGDADALRDDPAFRLAVSERRGISPLPSRAAEERKNKNPAVPDGLASQPTLSRLYGVLARPENLLVLRDALLLLAARRQKASSPRSPFLKRPAGRPPAEPRVWFHEGMPPMPPGSAMPGGSAIMREGSGSSRPSTPPTQLVARHA